MALITRCPQCGAAFRVVPDQLRVRNGLVRCGACSTVFDGRACLVSGPGALASGSVTPPPPPASAPVLSAPPRPAPPPWDEDEAAPAPSPAVLRGREDIRRHVPAEEILPEEILPEDPYPDEGADRAEDGWRSPAIAPEPAPAVFRQGRRAEPGLGVAAAAADRDAGPRLYAGDAEDGYEAGAADAGLESVYGDARTRYSSATDAGRAPPAFLDQDREDRRGLLRRFWGAGCLLALLALALQLLYVYRSDVAMAAPALRPVLEAACRPLGCAVGYARRLERISISDSSLQPPRGAAAEEGRARLVLRLALRNRYDKPQHWPALVLDLTDLSDTVVVRKVLMPEDYLTPEQLRGPFGPGGEVRLSVPLDVTGVQVNGYQLDKFFP